MYRDSLKYPRTAGGGSYAKSVLDAHIARVLADGGTFIQNNYLEALFFVDAIISNYGRNFTSIVVVCVDPHLLGYKLGPGSGVTTNQACDKLYSLSGAAGDVTGVSSTTRPLILVHTGENHVFFPGVSGNYLSTPNAASNQIIGDIDVRVKANISSTTTQMTLASKYNTNTSWLFRQNNAAQLIVNLRLSDTTAVAAQSTVAHPIAANTIAWFRFTRSSATGNIIFYTSIDGNTWTQLGATIVAAAGQLFNSTDAVEIGSFLNGTTQVMLGSIYRVLIYNGINGTLAVDFNPAAYNAAASQTQWTSVTGETWSINTGTSSTGYKLMVVDCTYLQTDASDDYMVANPGVIGGAQLGIYAVVRILNNVTTFNQFMELSSSSSSNPNSFRFINADAGAGVRRPILTTETAAGANQKTPTADPFTGRWQSISGEIDMSLPAADENMIYVNGAAQATNAPSTDQTATFNTAYPLYFFSRAGASRLSNMGFAGVLMVKNITKRVPMEAALRSVTKNFA